MDILGNKEIMANNIRYYMDLHDKTRKDICDDLGFSYSTFSDWINGKKYPRIDKIEIMANYFGIEKSDLVENKKDESKNEPKIMQYYQELNSTGKQEALKRIKELTYIPKYCKEIPEYLQPNAAHEIVGATEEDKQFDDDIMNDEDF